MTTSLRAGAVAVLATAVGLALAGCNSGSSGDGASEEATTSSAAATSSETPTESGTPAPTTSAQAAGPAYTIADYIRDNNIQETPVKPGDPGSPKVEFPAIDGWADAGPKTPEGAYRTLVFTDPAMAQDPPTINTVMNKLSPNADPAKILEFAPGAIKNLPGYEDMGAGKASQLSGFEAFQVGGGYTRDGVKHMVAEKTVVIPVTGALYVLQLRADGTEDQIGPLLDATSTIDDQTVITP